MKRITCLVFSAARLLLASCSTTPYVVKESDKLTDREKYHLFDYSRHFIIKTVITKPAQKAAAERSVKKPRGPQSREIRQKDLTPEEKEQLRTLIMSKDPTVRVRYTGYKEGKLSLSWVLPGKLQVSVSAVGKLDLSGAKEAQWRLNVIRFHRKGGPFLPEEIGIPAVD